MVTKSDIINGIMAFIITCCAFYIGISYERYRSPKPKPTSVMCESSDVLGGEGWRIDLTKALFDQSCTTHQSFPGKILCERMVTVECDLP